MKSSLIISVGFYLLLGSTACTSNRKLVDRGDYDRAIDRLVTSLAGKKKKSTEDVRLLERAFGKAQEEDLRQETRLKEEKDERNWEAIYAIHQRIDRRQDRIRPLLPLVSVDGHKAAFQFINTTERKRESKANSSEYYYNTAIRLIHTAENNRDKSAAREAVNILNKLDFLNGNYKDADMLRKKAEDLSTVHYLVRMVNNTYKIIPEGLETELTELSVADLNSKWKKFDMRKVEGTDYDYHLVINLVSLEFTPEREKSRIKDDIYREQKEDYQRDQKGNTVKDSTGKPVRIKTEVVYTNSIEEIQQSKSAALAGNLEWYNVRTKNTERKEPINVEVNFENTYGRLLKGDSKTLSKQARELVNRRPAPYPSNEQMTLDAGEHLKKIFKDIIRRVE